MYRRGSKKRPLSDRELLKILENTDFLDVDDNLYSSGESSEEEGEDGNGGIEDIQVDIDNYESEDMEEEAEQVADEDQPFVFEWAHDSQFTPSLFEFDETRSGCTSNSLNGESKGSSFFFVINKLAEDSTELEFFQLYFTPEFVATIAEQSNLQRSYLREDPEFLRKYHRHSSEELTRQELYVYFALVLLMTRCKKLDLHEYCSMDPLLSTPMFPKIMTKERYFFITKIFHLVDNKWPANGDKLHKIRYAVDFLRQKFREILVPFKNVCIDESLVLFKGRLSFKQYIPSKRHRFGIKLFMLCDCKTGVCLDFIVYTGGQTELEPLPSGFEGIGKSGQVVTSLMKQFFRKNHSLYLDNWYNSPLLAVLLHKQKTSVCGTIKKTRKFMPKFQEKLKRGELTFQSTGPVLIIKWCDKKDIHIITTMHDVQMSETGKVDRERNQRVMKPTAVLEYNKYMGGVDKSDMLISSIESVRKCMKWYKKLFMHFMDMCVINANGLYQNVTKKKCSVATFQL